MTPTPTSQPDPDGLETITHDMIRRALESVAKDDEGEFPPLMDLLGFSGMNKAQTVVRAALEAALAPKSPAVDAAGDLGDLIADLVFAAKDEATGGCDGPTYRREDAAADIRAYVAKLAAQRDALQAQLAEATAARAVPEELRALSDAATPGPWSFESEDYSRDRIRSANRLVAEIVGDDAIAEADAALIVALRNRLDDEIAQASPHTPGDASGSALITQQPGDKP